MVLLQVSLTFGQPLVRCSHQVVTSHDQVWNCFSSGWPLVDIPISIDISWPSLELLQVRLTFGQITPPSRGIRWPHLELLQVRLTFGQSYPGSCIWWPSLELLQAGWPLVRCIKGCRAHWCHLPGLGQVGHFPSGTNRSSGTLDWGQVVRLPVLLPPTIWPVQSLTGWYFVTWLFGRPIAAGKVAGYLSNKMSTWPCPQADILWPSENPHGPPWDFWSDVRSGQHHVRCPPRNWKSRLDREGWLTPGQLLQHERPFT